MKIWGPYSLLGLSAAAAACLTDQLHKLWMIGILKAEPEQKVTLAPFLDLQLTWNRGISYGLFRQDSDAGRWALIAFSVAAVLALAYWLAKFQNRLPAIGVGLIIGGALGNAIDRLHYGAVADFFYFHIGSFGWYIFNLADAAIVAGAAGVLYDSLTSSHKSAGNEV
ncbi:MAG: signal peptidase II [Rhodomicrobium sp.]|nr:signal peptidase II [Rhodomicrobium sp.]